MALTVSWNSPVESTKGGHARRGWCWRIRKKKLAHLATLPTMATAGPLEGLFVGSVGSVG
jgi:hypothetical protein